MCQQALEKCFKALLSFKEKEPIPVHNLRRLAELATVIKEMDEAALLKLDFLSSYYVNPRYKEDLQQPSKGRQPENSFSLQRVLSNGSVKR